MLNNRCMQRKVEEAETNIQHVIDTGLYGIVRHPMYMAAIVLFLAMQRKSKI